VTHHVRLIGIMAAGVLLTLPLHSARKTLPLKGRVIVLDPGHAVKNESGSIINPGAQGRKKGPLERDIALHVGAMVVPLLESQGATVLMTRTPDNPWRYSRRKAADNRARAIQANLWRADAYIRLHCDWNRSKNFKGITTYYYRWGSRPLAHELHMALARAMPQKRDNGIKRKSFVSVTARMPSVLLELGVLSNPDDVQDLAREDHQLLLAQAITEGVVTYFENVKP